MCVPLYFIYVHVFSDCVQVVVIFSTHQTIEISYAVLVLCVGIMRARGFLPKNPTYNPAKCLLSDNIARLVRQRPTLNFCNEQLKITVLH